MKLFLVALVATLFSTLAVAAPKDDLIAALAACTGAPSSPERHRCTQNAFAAFYVSVAPLSQAPAAKKAAAAKTVTRDASTGQFTTKAAAKASPSTTVTETTKK